MEEQNELQTKSFVPEETPEEDNPKKKLSKKQLILLLSCCFVFIVGVTLGAILIATPDINGTAYLTYSFDDTTKTATITRYTGNHTDLTIPDTIEGYIVTKIGISAFYNCDNLTSITIPDSVTEIGDFAFRYCSSLTSVTIGDSVTSIGNSAFYNCSSLTSVTIGNSVTEIGEWSFRNCYSLTSIIVTEGNTAYQSINGNLYSIDSKTLIQYAIGKTDTHFDIPDSVISIGSYAFLGCTSLTSVTIGNSVTSIGSSAFSSCFSLTSIIVTEGNTAYQSIDGNLYSIDSKTLIQYAIGKTDTHFGIPDSVTEIGAWAFYDCDNLASVTIGDSVTSIGLEAFRYCSSLTSIQYRGTEEQWSTISKGSNWDYDTSGYTLTYNYTDEEV